MRRAAHTWSYYNSPFTNDSNMQIDWNAFSPHLVLTSEFKETPWRFVPQFTCDSIHNNVPEDIILNLNHKFNKI